MLQNDFTLNQINNQCRGKKQLHHKLASECFTKQFYDVQLIMGLVNESYSFSSGNCNNMMH